MESCKKNQDQLKQLFDLCPTAESKYEKIIELGIALPKLAQEFHTKDHLVAGCQSNLYLHATYLDEKIYFQAHSDALISKGLAALFIAIYSGESPKTLLTVPPTVLHDLNLGQLLSPGRSNGLAGIYKKMQLLALHFS